MVSFIDTPFCGEPMLPFKARVDHFWKWFAENETALTPYFENPRETDPTPTRELLSGGINRIINNLPFEFGGHFEINFSANGRRELAFLTSYLAKALPEDLAKRWTITPLKPFVGQDFQIGMFDKQIGLGDVLVGMEPADNDRFFLRFYNHVLNEMDENNAYFFFFILLDAALGESVSISHIEGVDKADSEEESMIPLSELRDTIAAELAKVDRELNTNPCEYYVGYSGTPDENANPSELPLRHDIIAGFTCQQRLMDEYYSEDHSSFDLYNEAGAKAGFIWYFHEHEEIRDALDERNEITDRIIAEVLGEPGTGKELGLNIGQAMAPTRGYMDFLLYDEVAFLQKVGSILKDYDYTFYYTDYQPEAKSSELPKGWKQ